MVWGCAVLCVIFVRSPEAAQHRRRSKKAQKKRTHHHDALHHRHLDGELLKGALNVACRGCG